MPQTMPQTKPQTKPRRLDLCAQMPHSHTSQVSSASFPALDTTSSLSLSLFLSSLLTPPIQIREERRLQDKREKDAIKEKRKEAAREAKLALMDKKARARERQRERALAAKERLNAALRSCQQRRTADALARADAERELEETPRGVAPEPRGRLQIEPRSLADEALSAWAFVCAFSGTLAMEPFSPDDLANALCRPGDSVLLAELHVRLLRTLLAEPRQLREEHHHVRPPAEAIFSTQLLQQLPPPELVSAANW